MTGKCARCGIAPAGVTHVCPPPEFSTGLAPALSVVLPARTSLPNDLWARIVFAAKESGDWKLLRTLIEQAVMEARNG